MSLVSVRSRNLTQKDETGETAEHGENLELINIHAVSMLIAENAWDSMLSILDNPTLSAIPLESMG